MTTITKNKYQNIKETGRFIYNRISRIYPLYWFYSLVLLVFFFIRPELVNPSIGNRINIIESFLLLPQNILPLLMVGWTLVYEMYFYILFAFFLFINEKHFVKILILWCFSIIVGNLFFYPLSAQSWITAKYIVLSPFAFEFIFGCLIARIIFSGQTNFGVFFLSAGILIFFIICIACWFIPALSMTKPWTRAFGFGVTYSMIVYGSVALEINKKKRSPTPLQKIGDASYSIYLSHSLIINGIGWFWAFTCKTWSLPNNNLLWLLIMLIFSIIIGMISYNMLELPLINAARHFSGLFPKIHKE